MIARHACFSGRVQGVGFRYTARRIASNYSVTGYVKNLADGRVEILAEGDKEEVDAYLEELREEMSAYIRNAAIDLWPYSGRYGSFQIAY